MKKKILFVTESLARGGMERVLVDIANALVGCGYDVTILAYAPTDYLKADLHPDVHYIYCPRKLLKIRRRLPYFHRMYRKDKWEKRASARTLYRYYVGREKYDCEVGFYRGPSIKIISGSTNKKTKKIAWVHTDFKLCDPKSIIGFFNNMDEAKTAYRSFDDIVCVSAQAKESFVNVIGVPDERVSVIYNMIDAKVIQRKAQEECPLQKRKFTFVTVGRIIPDKGYIRLVDVVKRLKEEGFDFDLWIVGGGRAEEELKQHVGELQLNNVQLMGMQDNPYKYVKEADMFVCSSIREGFSLAVAEALLLDIPVLSTRCTGPTEILDNGRFGILVDNSEQGLYEGMKQVLSNTEKMHIFKGIAAGRGMDFNADSIVNQIVSLIEKN